MNDVLPTIQPLFAVAAPGGGARERLPRHRRGDALRRRLTFAVIAGALLVVATGAATLAGDTRVTTVWVEPFTLPAEMADVTPARFAQQLIGATATLAERARAVDEFAATPLPSLRFEPAHDAPAKLARVVRRVLGARDIAVSGEVTQTPHHVDILVRDVDSRATLKSRVPRDAQAFERVVALGADDVLLVTSPMSIATLALVDPRRLADGARLGEIASMLARHPSLASDVRSHLLGGAHAAASGDCRQAIDGFERAIAAAPAIARSYVLAADCYARLNRRDDALKRLASATERAGESARALSLAGDAYRRLGQPVRGLELLRIAQRKDSALPENAIAIGQTLLALHRPDEALTWLVAHPVDEAWRPRWLGVLGIAQVRSGQGPAAEQTAATLRARDPASVEAIRVEAELAAATKAWPQALGRFNALRLLMPGDGEAHAGEGRTLLALRRVADAIAAFEHCRDVSPWLAECPLGLGIALREADRGEAALVVLAEAAALDELDPRIPAEHARTLRALLRRDEAAPFAARADILSQRLRQKLSLP